MRRIEDINKRAIAEREHWDVARVVTRPAVWKIWKIRITRPRLRAAIRRSFTMAPAPALYTTMYINYYIYKFAAAAVTLNSS